MIAQHELLNQAARLIDQGRLRTTLGEHYGTINAANLRRAHAFIESGRAQGRFGTAGGGAGRPPADFLRRASRITARKRLKPRLRDARLQPRALRRTPLLAHMLDQALEPSLWAMVALTLLLLRFVPLQGWLAVLVAGITSGLILDTIQFRVGPRACGTRWSAARCWRRCWSPRCSNPCTRCSGDTVTARPGPERQAALRPLHGLALHPV